MAASSWFSDVPQANPIEVFKLTADYKQDPADTKYNLGVGAYRTDEGKPWVLPVVKQVEMMMVQDDTLNHEYLPVGGDPLFRKEAAKLLLGEDSPVITDGKYAAARSLGGTGALRIALDFLNGQLGCQTVYVSTPTWGNHKTISSAAGFKEVKSYRYWNQDERNLDLKGMIEDLSNAPEKSVVILHMCCHNPTGVDPTQDQWKQIIDIVKQKRIFPILDCAYQGFATGNLANDAWPVREFIREGMELFAAQSFSKNFGLYNERVGNCVAVTNSSDTAPKVFSQMEIIIRRTWSNPPFHGSRIVSTVLSKPLLCKEWMENVETMAKRILEMRKMLHENLRKLGTPHNWDHVITQTGMFSYTGLNLQQCKFLIEKKHIYLLSSGRINMCALTTKNLPYIAQSIDEAVRLGDECKL